MPIPLVLVLVVLAEPPKLEIRDVQASHGQFGPERKSAEYVAGDEVYFRFTVAGARADADGRLDGELRLTLADAKGKVLNKKEYAIQQVPALGGDSFPAIASWPIRVDDPPGEYEATVEYMDRLAKQTASFRRKFTVKPVEFALVRVRFYQDPDGLVPARVGGTVGQTLGVKFDAVGFDRSKGEIDVAIELQVFEKGKPVMPKPLRHVFHTEKPSEVNSFTSVGYFGKLSLNRAGDFTLRVTVTDTATKKTATFEAPLHVDPL